MLKENKEQFDIGDDYPNTYNRENVTCPFCGMEFLDSWEWKRDNGKEICDNCHNEFKWTRHISVDYESNPVKVPPQKH